MSEARPDRRRWWSLLLPLGGLVVGLVVLFSLVDVRAAGAALLAADPLWVGLSLGLALNASGIVAVKLWAVLRIVDLPRGLGRAWSAVMAGVSLNAVLPGRGGDLVRAVFLANERGSLPILLGAVLVERLIDLATLGLLVLLIAPRADWITLIAAGVVAGAIGGTALLAWLGPRAPFRPDLGERVARTASRMRERPGWAVLAAALSLAAWVNNTAMLVVCLWAVGVTAPFLELFRAGAVGILAGAVPISVAGIGTRDTVLVLTLQPYGQGAAVAAGSLLFTALMYWFLALVGSVALGRETLRTVRRAAAERRPVDEAQGDQQGAPD